MPSLLRLAPCGLIALTLALPAAAVGAPASASDPVNQWLPSSSGATWTYQWSDSQYAPTPTKEKYTLASSNGSAFHITWTTDGQGNGSGTASSSGSVDYARSDAGLLNTNWTGTAPPPQFPVLCPQVGGCGNSLAGTHFMLIWGSRGPVLAEPLEQGTSWSALGGASNDVSSQNRYLGQQRIVVPAFPKGVLAAKVQSDITQAGALGDPYGSGTRLVWWVRGVGPVRIQFRHTGGQISDADLVATNLAPRPAPSDLNYLPLQSGQTLRFRWRNSRWMHKYSVQQFTVSQVVNNTARVDVKSVSGPLRVAGAYVFSTRLSGVTNLAAATQVASLVKFPRLGPGNQPLSQRRHFFTPYDLMIYGFNPILTAYPAVRDTWHSIPGSRDAGVFGVSGSTRILGFRRITVPAGRFMTMAVESIVTQPGFRFGSGTRISYFAAGRGLVKLVFRHRDGSVSTVERLR